MLNIEFKRNSEPATDAEIVAVVAGIRPAMVDPQHPDRDCALLLAKMVFRITKLKAEISQPKLSSIKRVYFADQDNSQPRYEEEETARNLIALDWHDFDVGIKQMKSEKLKPCPFCGGDATAKDTTAYSSVRCRSCDFSITRKPESGHDARNVWNQRAPLPLAQQVDAVRGRFIIENWNASAEGVPLHVWVTKTALQAGGVAAAIDKAMRLAGSEQSSPVDATAAPACKKEASE